MADIIFERQIDKDLVNWADDPLVPGLLLLGPRQTGKTTAVLKLSKRFRNFIHLDNYKPEEESKQITSSKATEYLKRLSSAGGIDPTGKHTLILIELTGSETHLSGMTTGLITRYPQIKIIVSCHFRDSIIPEGFEELRIHPFTFTEFLQACGSHAAVAAYGEVPFPVTGFRELLDLFHMYCLVGGMPAAVARFSRHRNIAQLKPVYESIMRSFMESIMASHFRQKRKDLISLTLQNAFLYAGMRIKFNEFGHAGYGSREMSAVFRYLESQMLLRLNYPCTGVTLPQVSDTRKLPRLQLLDTGLVNYFSGIQSTLAPATDLAGIFQGQVLRHVVGQELSGNRQDKEDFSFWVRDKAQSEAEVDYVIPFDGLLIPVAVKSGEPGRLRSLHQFIDMAPHPYAVRLYAGNVTIRRSRTIKGKSYYLLSLPYFLSCRITEHLKGFVRYVSG